MDDELREAIDIVRAAVAAFITRAEAGDPTANLTAAKRIIGAAMARPKKKKGKPKRGLGFSEDEKKVIARQHKDKCSLAAAIRACFPKYDGDQVKNLADRIRLRKLAIEGDGQDWRKFLDY